MLKGVQPGKWYLVVDCAGCGEPIPFAEATPPVDKSDPMWDDRQPHLSALRPRGYLRAAPHFAPDRIGAARIGCMGADEIGPVLQLEQVPAAVKREAKEVWGRT